MKRITDIKTVNHTLGPVNTTQRFSKPWDGSTVVAGSSANTLNFYDISQDERLINC